MPRKRLTQSGAPAQKVESVAGQRYGEGVEQAALQRAMPAPNARAMGPSPSQPPMQAPVTEQQVAAPAPSDADRFAAALQQAQALRGQAGLLAQPTARPDEPVTAGLPFGPGPGPEVLGPIRENPTGKFFRYLTKISGDPSFAEMARRAGL